MANDRESLVESRVEAGAGFRISGGLFSAVRQLAYQTAGIDLQESKQEMVAGRLWKRARALGFPSPEDYFRAVEGERGGELETDLIDALTTNHTSFFREPAHFDFLREQILPELSRGGHSTIWCAASSTGEEPYSLATTALECLGQAASDSVRIWATDICHRVLRKASEGVYPADKFQQMPPAWCSRYLLKGKGAQLGFYRFRPEVRSMVRFDHLNLMEPFPSDGPFPLISLRNVMIYFDRPTQQKVVRAVSAKLAPGGYLFIGHSESLNGIDHDLELCQAAIYRKPKTRRSVAVNVPRESAS
jgi:chemotaxis protein methyltransferase CheR